MKNIHLLETIKVSKLHFDDKLFLSTNYQLSKGINSIVEGRNIYITNLEKTKLGEWVIYTNGIKIHCQKLDNKEDVELANIENSGVLKIILTTDADLIKDGVQAIDDEFLEWFVNNPNCELVEVKRIVNDYWEKLQLHYKFNYKIIIPQETLLEIANKKLMSNDWLNGAEFGAKWQQEQDKKLYSEENTIDLIRFLSMYEEFNQEGSVSKETAKYFLEKFKKYKI